MRRELKHDCPEWACPLHVATKSSIVLLVVLTMSIALDAYAGRGERPFWTEKSSFVEWEDLFVVGVASRAKTVEEGRKEAFENGRQELMNFAQVTNLEARGLVIETQMTYEEPNADGTVTVYRLLRVPADKLVAIQGRLQEQTRLQEQVLDKAQRDLQALQQSLARKQQHLEAQTLQIQETLDSTSRLQETLGQKAIRIEQTQREVEQLLKQLSEKVKHPIPPLSSTASVSIDTLTKEVGAVGPLLGKLKETEAKLDAQEVQLRDLAKRAKERLAREDELVRSWERKCKYLEPGMTKEEVEQIMSEKAEIDHHWPSRTFRYKYRYMNKKGSTEIISVGFAFNDLADSLDGCPGKSFSPYDHRK